MVSAICWYAVKAAFALVRLYDCCQSLIYLDRGLTVIKDIRQKMMHHWQVSEEDAFQFHFVDMSIQASIARARLGERIPICYHFEEEVSYDFIREPDLLKKLTSSFESIFFLRPF
jgi:hypothetical protein